MIAYRTARIDDYGSLCKMFEEIDKLHRAARPTIYRKPAGPTRERGYIEQILSDVNHLVVLALDDREPVGLLHASIEKAKDIPIVIPRVFARIECIVVTQSHRRRGVGACLLEQSERWAMTKGVRSIELGVWEFNQPAITFYHREGYTTATRRMTKHLYP